MKAREKRRRRKLRLARQEARRRDMCRRAAENFVAWAKEAGIDLDDPRFHFRLGISDVGTG